MNRIPSKSISHSDKVLFLLSHTPGTAHRKRVAAKHVPNPPQLYLATGCHLVDLHYTYRTGKSTASDIVRKVCCAIWGCLRDKCLLQPTEEEWKNIADGFQIRANFPNCIGAIDAVAD
ncbi:uncharacterized protein LOC126484026 isoform X1 [Schistocerca serialis cubense]|uniref:uncharacterized protein LOC126484026 isoform X1 n=1 Tax=Schistocerca serialis cubense TaxID=2023355 RepID=UPI00214F41EF|nr:uncharacterized protein LOC126484026 isoform X1 [Schistocerca serialis cubense]